MGLSILSFAVYPPVYETWKRDRTRSQSALKLPRRSQNPKFCPTQSFQTATAIVVGRDAVAGDLLPTATQAGGEVREAKAQSVS